MIWNWKWCCSAIAALAIALPLPTIGAAQSTPTGSEKTLFEAANRERASQHLKALQWDPALAAAARQHASRMARHNELSHQFPDEPSLQERVRGAGVHYSAIAENVGEGPSAESIHSQWMHSPAHRANLLDPDLSAIGIAAVPGQGDMLFAVEDFSQPQTARLRPRGSMKSPLIRPA
jgi:uncharacterized protein YkwD